MINLTQHNPTPDQIASGVVDLPAGDRATLRGLLTINDLPTAGDLAERAAGIAALATGHTAAMIGGAPYLMGPLAAALRAVGVTPYHSFTRRVVVETAAADGTTTKTAIFRHDGWIEG